VVPEEGEEGVMTRRALHRHDDEYFVRIHDVATHEHCESTMGHIACAHYSGLPVSGAIDGFRRPYNVWLSNGKPDCSQLLRASGSGTAAYVRRPVGRGGSSVYGFGGGRAFRPGSVGSGRKIVRT
jgi:hypothetical protein